MGRGFWSVAFGGIVNFVDVEEEEGERVGSIGCRICCCRAAF